LQFLFAADRDNKQVSDRFDPLSAPALRALRSIAETAARHKCPVTLCGEVGGRPLEAMALIGIGYRAFSMTPASIGPVKAMLLELNVSELENTMSTLLGASEKGSLRPALAAFAAAHGLPVQ
jgi:phosphotransferase system enzyme I (PtsP)